MSRAEILRHQKTQNKLITIIVVEAIVIGFTIGMYLAYKVELDKLQEKIIHHDRIANFVKEELVPGYKDTK